MPSVTKHTMQYLQSSFGPAQKLQRIPHLGHFHNIPKSQARPRRSLVKSSPECIPLAQQLPITYRTRTQILIHHLLGNPMQKFRIHLPPRHQQTPRLLQDPKSGCTIPLPAGIQVHLTLGLLAVLALALLVVNVQYDGRAEAHSRYERMIRGAILMRHDPLTRLVLIDQDVVWCTVRSIGEDAQGAEFGLDDRCCQPGG